MSDKLRQLGRRKLLQEYAFIKTDLEYKQTVLEENQSSFLEKAYALVGKERLEPEESHQSAEKSRAEKEKADWGQYEKAVHNRAKKLYREISKRTHPDRDPEGVYSETFSQAALAYDSCQIFELYEICDQLGIGYEIGEEEESLMKDEISKKKEQIKVVENSFAYMWSIYDNEKARDLIVRQFVRATRGKL
jgi:hypothetical protein